MEATESQSLNFTLWKSLMLVSDWSKNIEKLSSGITNLNNETIKTGNNLEKITQPINHVGNSVQQRPTTVIQKKQELITEKLPVQNSINEDKKFKQSNLPGKTETESSVTSLWNLASGIFSMIQDWFWWLMFGFTVLLGDKMPPILEKILSFDFAKALGNIVRSAISNLYLYIFAYGVIAWNTFTSWLATTSTQGFLTLALGLALLFTVTMAGVVATVSSFFEWLFNWFFEFVTSIPTQISASVSEFVDYMTSQLSSITPDFSNISEKISSIFDVDWYEKGLAGAKTFANGIFDGIPNILSTVDLGFGQLGDYFPASDAKVGPLSTLTLSGTRLMTTIAEGVNIGTPVLIDMVAKGLNKISLKSDFLTDLIPSFSNEKETGGIFPTVSSVINNATSTDIFSSIMNSPVVSQISNFVTTGWSNLWLTSNANGAENNMSTNMINGEYQNIGQENSILETLPALITQLLTQQEAEIAKMEEVANRPLEVNVYLDGEQLSSSVARSLNFGMLREGIA